MCGICGWLSFDDSPLDQGVVLRMTRGLSHRGPDDVGYYFSPDHKLALGQRRLSIIDLAGGHQPLANEDQTVWVTYNGEIYNFPELMRELGKRGHQFRTRCDTEVIVHAYEEYGLDFLSRLNGMFAFALWDARKKRLLLARDPFGIKPLYIWQNERQLLFVSEIKALLAHPDFPREVDTQSLDQFLTFQFVPSPNTLFKGVTKLLPGHYLVAEAGKVKMGEFARHAPEERRFSREAEAVEELRGLLLKAVKRQMLSDVPVGAMLSGGIDSATVVSLMREVTGHRIQTFTVGFTGDFRENELVEARRTAEILGTEHHDIILSFQDYLAALDSAVWYLDEPIATTSAIAMFLVSRLAANHVKVALTGQGADEPWAGYRRYRGEKLWPWYSRLPKFLTHGFIEPLIDCLPRMEKLKRAVFAYGESGIDPAGRFTNVYATFTPAMKERLYRNGACLLPDCRNVAPLRYWQSRVEHLPPLAQQLYVETRFSLADNLLLYGDKMSMASSLEIRVPFLDLELMEFIESLPVNLRLRGWTGHKYLFRKAIAKWLPREIMNRHKLGFATPINKWFQKEISGHLYERLTASGTVCDNYFNLDFIEGMIKSHASRKEDFSRQLFSLMILDRWYEQFIKSNNLQD